MVHAGRKILAILAIAIIVVFAIIVNLSLSHSRSSGHEPLVIASDSDFTEDKGVVSGSGSADNPYVIEGWTISAAVMDEYSNVPTGIYIKDTTAHFIVRDVVVDSPHGNDGLGIYLRSVANGVIENCTTRDRLTISCAYSTDIEIRDCASEALSLYYSRIMSARDCEISMGLDVYGSSSVEISGNSIGGYGIELYDSRQIDISSNNLEGEDAGIQLSSSYSCNVSGNSMTDVGLKFIGNRLDQFDSHTISTTNTVSGKEVASHKGEAVVEIAGSDLWQVIVFDCASVHMTDVNIDGAASPVTVTSASSFQMTDCTVANGETGVFLMGCSNVSITDSSVYSQVDAGVRLIECSGGIIYGNSVYSNGELGAGTTYGYWELGWTIPGGYGLALVFCDGIVTYHNTFMANALGGYDDNPDANIWNLDYETGGNYWRLVTDLYCGPSQDLPGPDGVGDDPITLEGGQYSSEASDAYPSAIPFTQITLPSPQEDETAEEDGITMGTICIVTIPMVIFIVVVLYARASRDGKNEGGYE